MADKPAECLHCCLIDAINTHAETHGPSDHADVLVALAKVTAQVLREALGGEQYPDEPEVQSTAKH